MPITSKPSRRFTSLSARVEKAGLHSDDNPMAAAFDEQWNWHPLDSRNALTTKAVEFQHALERGHARGLGGDRSLRREFTVEGIPQQLGSDVAVEAIA